MKVKIAQTKRIQIPCPKPEHQRFSDRKWKYNICQRFCHLGQELVCANCEGSITVNEKWEQECKNCKK